MPLEGDAGYVVNRSVVNRRGIYKDVLGCSTEWADYQFRPNFLIAIAVVRNISCSVCCNVSCVFC